MGLSDYGTKWISRLEGVKSAFDPKPVFQQFSAVRTKLESKECRNLASGILLIIVVFVFPRGIAGAVIALMKMVRDWRHT